MIAKAINTSASVNAKDFAKPKLILLTEFPSTPLKKVPTSWQDRVSILQILRLLNAPPPPELGHKIRFLHLVLFLSF